jgi:hypothetical protein
VSGGLFLRMRRAAAGMAMLAATTLAGWAAADDGCPFCAKYVVTNSDLAACFLAKYGDLTSAGAGAVAIDLTRCAPGRSIVAPLPMPIPGAERPDLRFLLSRAQVNCLREKLADPGLVLDPQARIDLESCG